MKLKYSSFLLIMVSLVLITSIIGCQKTTASTTTTAKPPATTTSTTPPSTTATTTLAPTTSTTTTTSPPTTTTTTTPLPTTTTTTTPTKSLTMTTTTTPPPTTTTQTPTFTPLVKVSPGDYEQLYLQTATPLNLVVKQSDAIYNPLRTTVAGEYWTVTVIKAGFFSTSSSGNTINYLRIDMSVLFTSMGSGHTFNLFNLAVTSPHAQYQLDSGDSTFHAGGQVFNQGDESTGYWIFQVQGTLDQLSTVQLSFNGGYDSGTPWLFQL